MTHPSRLVVLAALCLIGTAPSLADTGAAAAPLSDQERIVHALNRLGYGPRPGDVERVAAMGLPAYVEQQVHPEKIDDAAVGAKLAAFATLSLTPRELQQAYYAEIKRFVDTQRTMGNAEEMKLRTGVDIGPSNTDAAPAKPGMSAVVKEVAGNVTLRGLAELQTAKVIRAAESQRQLNEVLVDFWSNHFNVDVKKDACRVYKIVDDREVIRPHVFGMFRRLLGATAASPAMLAYLDNTLNSAPHELSPIEQRIRAGAIKKMFGVDDGSGMENATKPRTEGGLNENYARELLELHTLGVDGGYTQQDVVEVARCFTGWAVSPLTGTFSFEARRHDDGDKTVLGVRIPAGGGVTDGMKVLDLLAAHPSTARFVSLKLCKRFVADDPPKALVERVAGVFTKSGGDLREVVRAIVASDEFFARASYRAKVKSPLEYAVSAVRAAGGAVEPRAQGFVTVQVRHVLEGAGTIGYGGEKLSAARIKTLNWHVFDMGQPLFACQPPTGYTEDSKKWVSSGALIARLNFAAALTGGDVLDVKLPASPVATGTMSAEQTLDALVARVLHGDVSPGTKSTLLKRVGDTAATGETYVLALVLASPEFQRR